MMKMIRLNREFSHPGKLCLFLTALWLAFLSNHGARGQEVVKNNAKNKGHTSSPIIRAQQVLNLSLINVTIEEALNSISQKFEVGLVADAELLPDMRISVKLKAATLQEALSNVLAETGLEAILSKYGNVVVRPKVYEVYSTQEIIQGKVTDSKTGMPIPGVNILIKKTTQGTITDIDGNYTINAPDSASTLIFSFIGYVSQEVSINGRTRIDVALAEEIQSLNEVVVVGYGEQEKRDVTGAIGKIEMNETLNSRPIVDFGQAMYGKVPGIQVINASGRPGESSTIQVRGINSINAGSSPLIVVDGVPLPNYDLNSINSADIASIEVLKDASSAAIYGSRGANGVVLVTTKSGIPGKPSLNVSYNFSIQEQIRGYEMMNSLEYAQAAIDAAQNGWIESGGDPNAPNTIEARGKYIYTWPEAFEHPETLPNTNWQDLIIRQAPMHEAHVDFSGGNEKSRYYFSAGLLNQEGILITTDYKKYSLNLKGNSEVTNWFKLGAMANTTFHSENIYSANLQNIMQYPTIYPEYGENGYLGGPGTVEGFENYGAILYNIGGHPYNNLYNKNHENRFDGLGNLFGEITFLPFLKYRTAFNVAYSRNDHILYDLKDNNLPPAYTDVGTATSQMSRNLSYSFENFLLYDQSFKNQSISAMVGYEFNSRNYYMLQAKRADYDNDLLQYVSAGNTVSDAIDDIRASTLISFIGRINYNYKEKYLATATLRRDGSSRFGPDNKWGNFPSISVGWRASEEDFMQKVNWVSDLKFRGSVGYTGNENFENYRWISQMTMGRVPIGDNLNTSYYPSSIENADLRWERTLQYDLGVDMGILNNRIALEMDFYKSKSDGLLLDVPVPSTVGFTSVFQNIGEIQNKGVELGITSHNLAGKLSWTTEVNFSANRNEVTKLGPNDAPRYYSHGQSIGGADFVGQPMGNFFGYKFIGVFMNQDEVEAETVEYPFTIHPGDAMYADINGDNVLNEDDRTSIGNSQPDFLWALTNRFTFKNFDLSFMFHGVVGNDVYNGNYRRSMIYHEGRNYMKRLNNRWRSETNPGDGTVPKVSVLLDGFEKTASSFWITDGTYLRLKDVTIGYNLPSSVMERIGLSGGRIYFNGLNLFTFTDTEVQDPENFNGSGGLTSTVARGVSHGVYPTAKVYTLGINVKF